MCVRRDRAYLDWKYARCPHRRYDDERGAPGRRLAGFAVSRHEDYRGVRLGWIIDLFTDAADEDAQDALLGAVLDEFRAAGVARAQAFSHERRPRRAACAGAASRGPLAHAVLRARARRARRRARRPRAAGTSCSATATWTDERSSAGGPGRDRHRGRRPVVGRRAARRSACATRSACPPCRRCSTSFGVRPTYVVTWEMATRPESAAVLRDLARTGRCEIGTHLHPWSSPPFRPEDLAGPHLSAQPAAGPARAPDHRADGGHRAAARRAAHHLSRRPQRVRRAHAAASWSGSATPSTPASTRCSTSGARAGMRFDGAPLASLPPRLRGRAPGRRLDDPRGADHVRHRCPRCRRRSRAALRAPAARSPGAAR